MSYQTFAIGLCLVGAFSLRPVDAKPPLKVINGRVREVQLEKSELRVTYRHPVSGQTEELLLRVDQETGFPEGLRLSDLQEGEPVSIDYEGGDGSSLRAVLVKPVPLKGVPLEPEKR